MHPGPVVPPTPSDPLAGAEDLLIDVEELELAEQSRVFAVVHQKLTTALAAAGEERA